VLVAQHWPEAMLHNEIKLSNAELRKLGLVKLTGNIRYMPTSQAG
jgi:hypothetical protein